MFFSIKNKKGFTLIELLVVVSIISLLSSVVITELTKSRNRAKMTASFEEVSLLKEAIILAQGNSSKTLRQITGSNWTMGSSCRNRDIKNVTDSCYTRWVTAVDKIIDAAGPVYDDIETSLYRDEWGSPYLIDENEGETSTYCRRDVLNIVGPDGIYNTSDDIRINLPYTGYGQQNCNN